MKQSFNFVWFLACPIIVGLIGVVSNFVPIFYGEGYEKVATIICVMSPIVLAIGLNNVTGVQYLLQVKKQNIFTITVIVGAIVNVCLNFILINVFKSIGAAIASVIAEVAILVLQIIYIRKEINIKNIYTNIFNYIVSSIVMFVIVFSIKNIFSNQLYTLVAQIVIGIIVYFGMLLILRDKFFKEALDKVLKKFKIVKE